MVASWSSSFEPKCAKRPLLLIPTASASRPIESPSMPSTVASLRRFAQDRLAAPLAVAAPFGAGLCAALGDCVRSFALTS